MMNSMWFIYNFTYLQSLIRTHLTTRLCVRIVTRLATLAIEGQTLWHGVVGGVILTSCVAIDLLTKVKMR